MRTPRVRLLVLVSTILTFVNAAMAASGPQTAWNVFTLPNPQITPNWRTYAPSACESDPDGCAADQRFWELWDFSNFQQAIDASFAGIHSTGRYQGVMLIVPLTDTANYWSNIKLVYQSAASHSVQLQIDVFPKWKYGPEYCYLYKSAAPSGCQLMSGTTNAVAFQKLVKLMKFVQTLNGSCPAGSYNRRVAVWYGWSGFSPGYIALKNFWQWLPTNTSVSGCNLQAAYITWLDTAFTGTPEVQQLQNYVVTQLKRAYWINTELYSTTQLQQYTRPMLRIKRLSRDTGAPATSRLGRRVCARTGTPHCIPRDSAPGRSTTLT